jgi:predicted HTH domain antitoxin
MVGKLPRGCDVSTEALTLTVPAALAPELDSASQEFLVEILKRGLREWKIERALERYASGGFSFGAAAHQAGVSQSELARWAYARGMEPPFSAETLAEELGG